MLLHPGQLGNTVGASVGRFFFDRERVLQQLHRGEAKRLSKAGAFVRRRMRSKIRKARRLRINELSDGQRDIFARAVERAEREGRRPPRIWWFKHSEPGQPPRSIWGQLREHIYFAYDEKTRSVVTGPAILNGTDGSVPHVLEYGGQIESRRLGRNVTIEARPFARPSLEEEADNFPELFRQMLG
jgi:hypothetical protein